MGSHGDDGDGGGDSDVDDVAGAPAGRDAARPPAGSNQRRPADIFATDDEDGEDGAGDADDGTAPLKAERRRTVKRTSAAGAFAGAIALGLREVFEPPERDEIVEVVPQGEPDPDAPVELLYLKDQPDRSRARVRPWLLQRRSEKRR